MAKWLTRWSAKPVFMGSNPIRCSNNFNSLERERGNVRAADYCSGKCSECRAFLCSLLCFRPIEPRKTFAALFAPHGQSSVR